MKETCSDLSPGTVGTGATYAFSQRPLSRGSCPFVSRSEGRLRLDLTRWPVASLKSAQNSRSAFGCYLAHCFRCRGERERAVRVEPTHSAEQRRRGTPARRTLRARRQPNSPFSILAMISSIAGVIGLRLRSSSINSVRHLPVPAGSRIDAKYASATASDRSTASSSSIAMRTISLTHSSNVNMAPSIPAPQYSKADIRNWLRVQVYVNLGNNRRERQWQG